MYQVLPKSLQKLKETLLQSYPFATSQYQSSSTHCEGDTDGISDDITDGFVETDGGDVYIDGTDDGVMGMSTPPPHAQQAS